jgi:hypothetical protein
MEASKLRKGNHTKQGKIISFYESGIHVGYGATFSFNNVEPIEITKEWLVGFGWGIGDFDTEYIDSVSLKNCVLIYHTGINLFLIETLRDVIQIEHIKYVHQLQNLCYSLTGEELTIIDN